MELVTQDQTLSSVVMVRCDKRARVRSVLAARQIFDIIRAVQSTGGK